MCNSGSLLHNLQIPPPTAEFFVDVTFFSETRTLPQSSVRARAGHRPCSVKPGQVHEGNLSKRLAVRASSKRLRQQKIPPWANPSASCTLLTIYSWFHVSGEAPAPKKSPIKSCTFIFQIRPQAREIWNSAQYRQKETILSLAHKSFPGGIVLFRGNVWEGAGISCPKFRGKLPATSFSSLSRQSFQDRRNSSSKSTQRGFRAELRPKQFRLTSRHQSNPLICIYLYLYTSNGLSPKKDNFTTSTLSEGNIFYVYQYVAGRNLSEAKIQGSQWTHCNWQLKCTGNEINYNWPWKESWAAALIQRQTPYANVRGYANVHVWEYSTGIC